MEKSSNLKLAVFCFAACKYDRVFINRDSDNKDGKAFQSVFYSMVESKNFNEFDSLLSDSLKHLGGEKEISKMANFINSKAGNYKKL